MSKCTFDPVIYTGAPIGMFHCPECGEMVLAGVPHPNYDTKVVTVEIPLRLSFRIMDSQDAHNLPFLKMAIEEYLQETVVSGEFENTFAELQVKEDQIKVISVEEE